MSLRASIARLLATNVVLVLVAFAIIPLVTRMVPPGEWGRYQLMVNVAVMAASVLFLRFDMAFIVTQGRQARRLIAAAVLPISAVTLLVFAVALTGLVSWREEYGVWTFLAMPTALGLAFYQMMQVIQAAEQDYRAYNRTKVQVQLGQSLCLLIAAYVAPHFLVLLFAWSLPLLPVGLRYVAKHRVRGIRRRIWPVISRQRAFVLYNTPSVLVNNVRMVVPLMMLFAVADVHEYGLFVMAARLLDIPVSVVGMAFQHVLLPKISQLWQREREKAVHVYFRALGVLFSMAVMGWVVLLVVPDSFYSLVLGGEWKGLREFLVAVCAWKLAEFLNVPLAPVSDLLGLQRVVAVIRVAFTGVTIVLMMLFSKDIGSGVGIIVITSAAYYLSFLIISCYCMLEARKI